MLKLRQTIKVLEDDLEDPTSVIKLLDEEADSFELNKLMLIEVLQDKAQDKDADVEQFRRLLQSLNQYFSQKEDCNTLEKLSKLARRKLEPSDAVCLEIKTSIRNLRYDKANPCIVFICKLLLFILKPVEGLFTKLTRFLHRAIYPVERIPPSERALFSTDFDLTNDENLVIEQYKELNSQLDSLYRRRTIINNTFSTLSLGIVTGIWFIYTTIVSAAAIKFEELVLIIAAPPAFGVLISIFWLIVNGHYLDQGEELLNTIKMFERKMPARIVEFQEQTVRLVEYSGEEQVPSKRFTYMILPTVFFAIFGVVLFSCVIPANGYWMFFCTVLICFFALGPYLSEDILPDSFYLFYTVIFFLVFAVSLSIFVPGVSHSSVDHNETISAAGADSSIARKDDSQSGKEIDFVQSLCREFDKACDDFKPSAKEKKVIQKLFIEVNNASKPDEIVKAKLAQKIQQLSKSDSLLREVENLKANGNLKIGLARVVEDELTKELLEKPSSSKDVTQAITELKDFIDSSNKTVIEQINLMKESIPSGKSELIQKAPDGSDMPIRHAEEVEEFHLSPNHASIEGRN